MGGKRGGAGKASAAATPEQGTALAYVQQTFPSAVGLRGCALSLGAAEAAEAASLALPAPVARRRERLRLTAANGEGAAAVTATVDVKTTTTTTTTTTTAAAAASAAACSWWWGGLVHLPSAVPRGCLACAQPSDVLLLLKKRGVLARADALPLGTLLPRDPAADEEGGGGGGKDGEAGRILSGLLRERTALL